jgi:outer membrane lipoprotein-sorting protein
MNKKLLVVIAALFVSSSAFAADLPLDDLIKNIQSNQSKIKDMYAETTTTITSNMAMPGQESKGPQKMAQKGKMWTKGSDKSKIEMTSPMKQVTITNGDQMAIINSETGQKVVQDLKKLKGQGASSKGQGEMNLEKAKEFFNLEVTSKQSSVTSKKEYIITGTPKQDNKFLGKMEFYVDSDKWVPVKIVMYDAKGRPMSQSEIEYERVKGQGSSSKGEEEIWIPVKNVSNVVTPMGSMKVEMEFSNIKVNKGISDKEFAIE